MQSFLTGTTRPASRRIVAAVAFAVAFTLSSPSYAEGGENALKPASSANLPDAPSAIAAARTPLPEGESSSLQPGDQATAQNTAPSSSNPQDRSMMESILFPRIKFVGVGEIAPKQTVGDKILLGTRESVTPFAVLGWAFSAGWSQLIDSSPNYGQNSEAFAQRFGAAAALNTSKEIFSDAVLASVFHQDPRYYQLGRSHTFASRTLYAVTRPIIGRTDGGRTIPNYAFILGTGGAAALTHTYYPERNVTPGQVMQTWGSSLGGSAAGYLVSEFGGDLTRWLRISRHQ